MNVRARTDVLCCRSTDEDRLFPAGTYGLERDPVNGNMCVHSGCVAPPTQIRAILIHCNRIFEHAAWCRYCQSCWNEFDEHLVRAHCRGQDEGLFDRANIHCTLDPGQRLHVCRRTRGSVHALSPSERLPSRRTRARLSPVHDHGRIFRVRPPQQLRR